MGAGKSTLAAALSERLGMPWRDSDRDIETLTGRTGRELSADATVGVDGLHHLEEAVLLGVLAAEDRTIVSAAGWVVESPLCCTIMRHRSTVVWLQAPASVLVERMHAGAHRRPLSISEVAALVARREPLFRSVADHILDATDPVDVLVSQVLADQR
jgi:shikimate kinase